MTFDLYPGNCLDTLQLLDDNSVDSIVTDPPYGLSFMGKRWDYDVPSEAIWREALRVLKPGGHLLAFAGTRTQHRMAVRIEDAGFEIRDMIAWVYGCLSEDSEVLTEDGWMPYNRAKQKNILAYDLQNDIYQWEKPSRWNEYRVESDTAYRIQSDHTDQIVSRNHRCIVERGGMLAFVPADELAGMERVPYLQGDFSALPQGRSELLLQAVLREGEGLAQAALSERQGEETAGQGACWGEKPGMEGRADLLQAQGQIPGSVDQVRPLPCGTDEHGPQRRVSDGASACGGAGDWQTADAGGMCAPHQPRRDGQPAGEFDAVCDQCGSQAVRARASYQTTLATVTAIEYSGMIWCPTVSTGAFVARRNGKVFITGNSGFPKSLDVSKAIDRSAGAEREVTREGQTKAPEDAGKFDSAPSTARERRDEPATEAARQWQGWGTALKPALEPITVARKPLAGTVAENVLAHGTGAINVDGCRVGDEVRYNAPAGNAKNPNTATGPAQVGGFGMKADSEGTTVAGRWPANLIHDGSDEVLAAFPQAPGQMAKAAEGGDRRKNQNVFGTMTRGSNGAEPRADTGSAARFFQQCKSVYNEAWQDLNLPSENASTAELSSSQQRQAAVSALVLAVNSALPEGLLCSGLCLAPSTTATGNELRLIADSVMQAIQTIGQRFWLVSRPARLSLSLSHASVAVSLEPTGTTTITVSHWRSDGSAEDVTFSITPKNLEAGGKGCEPSTANRLIYCAKASKSDRGEGNTHPTVKPTELMRYLCRLVTPPGGVVLDPFMGSGSTGKAAVLEGFRFIGCELSPEYMAIAQARIAHALTGGLV